MSFEYLLSTLPPIETDPPLLPDIAGEVLFARIEEEGGNLAKLSRELFLTFDILCLEDISRNLKIHEPVVFRRDELERKDNLPYWLELALEGLSAKQEGYPFEKVWHSYFNELVDRSLDWDKGFFADWLDFDNKMRNGVEAIRLGQRGAGQEVWREAYEDEDPFKLDRVLLKQRLNWLNDAAPRYTFDENEVLGYVLKYITLHQGRYLLNG
ncbi:MAG: hypothetical protein ABIE74_11465 [Pseudomonadota bacterium]